MVERILLSGSGRFPLVYKVCIKMPTTHLPLRARCARCARSQRAQRTKREASAAVAVAVSSRTRSPLAIAGTREGIRVTAVSEAQFGQGGFESMLNRF
jgi:hypothetical protein